MASRSAQVLLAGGLLLTTLVAAGCDTASPEVDEAAYVVESYLVAQEPLPPVRVGRTLLLDSTYAYAAQAVTDAQVVVEALGPDGAVTGAFPYAALPDTAGVYGPLDTLAAVEPLRRYRLRVTVPEGGGEARLEATTLVPDTFRVVDVTTTDVAFGQPQQIELRLTASTYPGRDQSFYVLSAETLLDTLRTDSLTPLVAQLADGNDDFNLEEQRVGSSPVLNEANYEVEAGGTLRIKVPWIAFSFYGPNVVRASVVDDNLYDYLRSQQAQQGGGSTFAPGELPNILERVDGGTGIFGSMARQSVPVVVRRAPSGPSP